MHVLQFILQYDTLPTCEGEMRHRTPSEGVTVMGEIGKEMVGGDVDGGAYTTNDIETTSLVTASIPILALLSNAAAAVS